MKVSEDQWVLLGYAAMGCFMFGLGAGAVVYHQVASGAIARVTNGTVIMDYLTVYVIEQAPGEYQLSVPGVTTGQLHLPNGTDLGIPERVCYMLHVVIDPRPLDVSFVKSPVSPSYCQ